MLLAATLGLPVISAPNMSGLTPAVHGNRQDGICVAPNKDGAGERNKPNGGGVRLSRVVRAERRPVRVRGGQPAPSKAGQQRAAEVGLLDGRRASTRSKQRRPVLIPAPCCLEYSQLGQIARGSGGVEEVVQYWRDKSNQRIWIEVGHWW